MWLHTCYACKPLVKMYLYVQVTRLHLDKNYNNKINAVVAFYGGGVLAAQAASTGSEAMRREHHLTCVSFGVFFLASPLPPTLEWRRK